MRRPARSPGPAGCSPGRRRQKDCRSPTRKMCCVLRSGGLTFRGSLFGLSGSSPAWHASGTRTTERHPLTMDPETYIRSPPWVPHLVDPVVPHLAGPVCVCADGQEALRSRGTARSIRSAGARGGFSWRFRKHALARLPRTCLKDNRIEEDSFLARIAALDYRKNYLDLGTLGEISVSSSH